MRFSERFKKKALFPVIHVCRGSFFLILSNARIAYEEGADGIFIISHDGLRDADLLDYHECVKNVIKEEWHADFWVGVNCLHTGNTYPSRIFGEISRETDGLWIDSIDRGPFEPEKNIEELGSTRRTSGWDGLLFGGVAFKYQPHVPSRDLPEVARRATACVDVVTTSGNGTGEAPALEKIETIKESIGNFPLAIASGITPENVRDYLPYTDAFLVSTGISKDFTHLDRMRVRKLRAAIDG